MSHSVALLLHLTPWELEAASARVGPGITINAMEGSTVERAYHFLCSAEGLDDGEPFSYTVFVLFEPTEDHSYLLGYGDPYAVVDRFVNIFTIEMGRPTDTARIIWSTDWFNKSLETFWLYTPAAQTEFLATDFPPLTEARLQSLIRLWSVAETIWHADVAQGRITNALAYFYYAWRSHHLDQTCVHLAIALETLFAPHSQGETTHQIAFNIAHYMRDTPAERAELYSRVKKFYGLRSAVVHGGRPDYDTLIDTIPNVFRLTAEILGRVLSSEDAARQFEDTGLRRAMFDRFLFN
jgi:hypothetical protein